MGVNKNEANYWDKRYQDSNTGWDIGYANPALVSFVQQNFSKETNILIPGAGSAYELAALYNEGYQQVYALDFSQTAKNSFHQENLNIPLEHYLCMDFFELDQTFDLVLEQTFFCALPPTFREKYRDHVKSLLSKGGILAGLMFDMVREDGPPFGGNRTEYETLFGEDFIIDILEKTDKSIEPRLGKEFFVKFIRK